MKVDIINMLKMHEGFRQDVYICPSGFRTIGIGHNLDANPIDDDLAMLLFGRGWNEKLTLREAKVLLKHDIKRVTKSLEKNIPDFKNFDHYLKTAFIDLTFNMGIGGVLSFKRMLAALKVKNKDEVMKELVNSKWAKQVQIQRVHYVIEMLNHSSYLERK